jgi:hypothetical protein
LYRENGVSIAIKVNDTNKYSPNSCPVSVQVDASNEPGEDLPEYLTDCSVIGRRLYTEET